MKDENIPSNTCRVSDLLLMPAGLPAWGCSWTSCQIQPSVFNLSKHLWLSRNVFLCVRCGLLREATLSTRGSCSDHENTTGHFCLLSLCWGISSSDILHSGHSLTLHLKHNITLTCVQMCRHVAVLSFIDITSQYKRVLTRNYFNYSYFLCICLCICLYADFYLLFAFILFPKCEIYVFRVQLEKYFLKLMLHKVHKLIIKSKI